MLQSAERLQQLCAENLNVVALGTFLAKTFIQSPNENKTEAELDVLQISLVTPASVLAWNVTQD